jgi:Ca2+-binding RTX toxin-like protein
MFGGDGNDAMNGDAGNDFMDGGVGSDQMVAGAGADSLFGFAGDDGLYGGIGDDWLEGGVGVDGLFGGAGNDTYVFDVGSGGLDVIFDGEFRAGTSDLIAVQNAGSGVDLGSMLSRAYETSGVVVIPFSNTTGLYVVGYTIASLSADDFAFI